MNSFVNTIIGLMGLKGMNPVVVDLNQVTILGGNGLTRIPAGELLFVEVNENPSTGYRWIVSGNECGENVVLAKGLEIAQEGHVKENQLFGSETQANFAFQSKAGENSYEPCEIEFTECRMWDCENTVTQKKTIDVNVV